MNALLKGSFHLTRTAFMLVFASFLMTAGHATGLAQADAQPMAVQYFEGMLGTGNLNAASALVSPDALLHTPEGSYRGSDGAVRFATDLGDSFADLEFTMQTSTDVGDLVVVRFTMTGTHTGAYLGLRANCAGIAVPGMAVLRSGDAGITEQWISYDRRAVIDQIHAFSRLDAGEGTACTGSQQAVPTDSPTCLRPTECESPW